MSSYKVNEIFYSLQGEGGRAGEPSFFLRFTDCNLRCSKQNIAGFDCDTEFMSGKHMELHEIHAYMKSLSESCRWIVLTGGEPGLQVDETLITYFKALDYKLAIETNGTIALPDGLDWITVSPKSAEHSVRQKFANEVKYVRRLGQDIPVPSCKADLQYISPAFEPDLSVQQETIEHCVKLCKQHPQWRLSLQLHKLLGVR